MVGCCYLVAWLFVLFLCLAFWLHGLGFDNCDLCLVRCWIVGALYDAVVLWFTVVGGCLWFWVLWGVFCGDLVVGFVFDGLLILVLVYLLCSIFVVASFALCFAVRLLCLALVGPLDW